MTPFFEWVYLHLLVPPYRCLCTMRKRGRVPNSPKTPNRTVRIPDEIWRAVQRKAQERGETVTDVIIRALKRYLRD